MTSIFKILTLNVLFVFLAVSAQAQKDNAHIQYDINIEGNEQAAMMNGSTIDVYFAPDNSKMVLNMLNGMIKMDMRMNVKSEKGIVLLDMMGQQKYKTLDANDIDKEDKAESGEKPNIKYLSQYKEIAGYKCQKAVVTKEGQDNKMIVYFTDQIEMPKGFDKYVNQLNMAGMKGFPMAMEIVGPDNMKINITAKAVDMAKQSKKIFEVKAPEGYTEMTEEDLKTMGGGMGGF